jgi:hypothetical protein
MLESISIASRSLLRESVFGLLKNRSRVQTILLGDRTLDIPARSSNTAAICGEARLRDRTFSPQTQLIGKVGKVGFL